jgi:RNA polymerase primary sigma factor
MDVDKILMVDEEEEFPAIARLIEMGRQKGYITLDDILHFFPEAEQDVEQLEEAFSALLSAGIPFVEDTAVAEPTEDELVAVEATEIEPEIEIALDDYLANIDTDDTIGLSSKKSAAPTIDRGKWCWHRRGHGVKNLPATPAHADAQNSAS